MDCLCVDANADSRTPAVTVRSGGSVLVAREVGDAGEGGTVMMTGSVFSRVDLGALRALLELGRPQRPDHGGDSPLALFHAGQYALDLDLSMPVSTRTSQHGTISREPSGQDLEGGLGADPARPPAKSLEPSPSRWWHKTMGRSIVVDRGPAAGPALVPRGAIRANLLCTYPPELAGRGPLHGTMLRRGRQLSPHVLCAPTGDVTLVFAAFSAATARALMARDEELGESSIEASMQYLEAACLRFYGYEIELAPGSIYAAFAESGDALAFACAVQQELMDIGWPEGVLAMAECAELEVRGESAAVSRRTERVTVFRGPRIAVGIAAGDPGADAVVHHGTGRATYPGILANRAARINGLAAPGQTLCNAEAFDRAEASEAAGFDATDLGSIHLKGVKEPVELMWVHTPLLQQRPVPKLKPGA